ncbi:MAG TPA: hypothetical protein VF054_07510 [Micromonosporaceae bacterium]
MRYDTEPRDTQPRDLDGSPANAGPDSPAYAGSRIPSFDGGADEADSDRPDLSTAGDEPVVGEVTRHEHDARKLDRPRVEDTDAGRDVDPRVDTAGLAVDPRTDTAGLAEDPHTDDTGIAEDSRLVDADDADAADTRAVGTAAVSDDTATGTVVDTRARSGDTATRTGVTTSLWPDGAADSYRSRWREIQLRFVDDPHGATDEAGHLVGEVIDALAETFRARHEGAREWRTSWDTEALRTSVQRYRDLMDRLLGM